MSGELLSDGAVTIRDVTEAATIYSRGFFGDLSSSGLALDRVEAAYLLEMGRVDVRSASDRRVKWADLFRRALRAERGFGVRYLVYRDLRQRGYVVRSGPPPVAFSVLPRGGTLHKTPARFWVEVHSERAPFDLASVSARVRAAQSAKKSLLLGVVDEESDLTYYRVRRSAPHGAPLAPVDGGAAHGWLTDDRVVVVDPDGASALAAGRAFGSRIGGRLELSLIEATYLLHEGRLALRSGSSGRAVTPGRLERRARRIEGNFTNRLAVYRDLRSRNMVVKTGFKYGAHFRAYPRDPERAHARYLVHAVEHDFTTDWPEVAGAVRLAQGVRKEFLFGIVEPDAGVTYLALERVRP